MRQQEALREPLHDEQGSERQGRRRDQVGMVSEVELTVEQGLPHTFRQRQIAHHEHRGCPAKQEQQAIGCPLCGVRRAIEGVFETAGQAGGSQPAEHHRQAGEHRQQGAGSGGLGKGQGGQPLAAQAKVTAEQGQQHGEHQPGQERSRKERVEQQDRVHPRLIFRWQTASMKRWSWLTTSNPQPASARRRSTSSRKAVPSGSRLLVGSSSRTTSAAASRQDQR